MSPSIGKIIPTRSGMVKPMAARLLMRSLTGLVPRPPITMPILRTSTRNRENTTLHGTEIQLIATYLVNQN